MKKRNLVALSIAARALSTGGVPSLGMGNGKSSRHERFNADFDAALLSLDEGKIRWFCRKWNMSIRGGLSEFWVTVHTTRLQRHSLPEAARLESFSWLKEHGHVKEEAPPPDEVST